MTEYIIIIILGALITALGICNFLGYIDTVHWYHRSRITEATRRPYGRAMGIGTMTIGASLILFSALVWATQNTWIYLGLIAGMLIGSGFILFAQLKYNRGIF